MNPGSLRVWAFGSKEESWGWWMSWLRLVSVLPPSLSFSFSDRLAKNKGLFRATIVLRHYRGLSLPTSPKFNAWLQRVLDHPAVKKTCSTEELYIESYERWGRL
jgi:hypothetical protein